MEATSVASFVKAPTIPYPGAKGRLAPTIVSLMPKKGRTYVEPFVGRGNVFWAAALNCQYDDWHINDIQTAPFFEALREKGGTVRVPARTKEEFYRQKSKYRAGDPRALLLEPYLTFSGGGYIKGGFGGFRSANAVNYTNTLRRCTEIIRKTSVMITGMDWSALPLDNLTWDDFVFLDPPYFGADVRAYASTHFDYESLVSTLRRARFRWLLTEYRQPFYIEQLGEPFMQRKVQLACDRLGTRDRIECFWRNY